MRRITWLGHATALIEVGGARLLTDPVLRGRVAHLRRHAPAPPAGATAGLDAVLISHVHRDHLDLPSMRRIAAPRTTSIVPRGAARLLRDAGFAEVREVVAGDTLRVGAATVEVVPAWHPARRGLRGPDLDALGYVVERIWFAGDTDIDPAMEELRGRVDVALLPIWGWGPTLGAGHLDPASAAQAAALVAPQVVVPIHWGTFLPVGTHRRHGTVLSAPAQAFAAQVARAAPSTRVATLAIGEALSL